MASSSQPVNPQPRGRQRFGTRVDQFWKRVTDGLELNQLWNQFHTEARASYSLYSREIDSTRKEGVRRAPHFFGVAKQLFWAILEKLSPARRVLLLLSLVLMVFNPEFSWTTKGEPHVIGFDLRLWGGLLMFLLLILEVADRVVMKRDLQIAREIQSWLLPANPPPVPGMEIAFPLGQRTPWRGIITTSFRARSMLRRTRLLPARVTWSRWLMLQARAFPRRC